MTTPEAPTDPPLLVVASIVLVSLPDATRLAGNVAGLDHPLVADMSLSETAGQADVVLPITQ